MYVILQLQHSVGDVSNSTSSTVQSLTELVVFFFFNFLSLSLFLFYLFFIYPPPRGNRRFKIHDLTLLLTSRVHHVTVCFTRQSRPQVACTNCMNPSHTKPVRGWSEASSLRHTLRAPSWIHESYVPNQSYKYTYIIHTRLSVP